MTGTPMSRSRIHRGGPARAKGAGPPHSIIPYHEAMYEGRATREQIRGSGRQPFHYQAQHPLKDAAIWPTARTAICASSG